LKEYEKQSLHNNLDILLSFPFSSSGRKGTAFITPEGVKPSKPGTRAPIITHAFAVERGYYGYIWKIYIEAEDPDGDMLRIASVVNKPVMLLSNRLIYLKSPYQKHFKGYIQWNTFSSRTTISRGTQIALKYWFSTRLEMRVTR